MSQVRIAMEWLFGDIANYFKFIDYKKKLKIGLSSVGKMYLVCAILNALTCLYGNTTSEFFVFFDLSECCQKHVYSKNLKKADL